MKQIFAFADNLLTIHRLNKLLGNIVTVHLHVTASPFLGVTRQGYSDMSDAAFRHVVQLSRVGRPDLNAVVSTLVESATGRGSDVLAMTCGPESLVHDMSIVCFRHGVNFESEEFFY